mgnify:CR=1 FL=1
MLILICLQIHRLHIDNIACLDTCQDRLTWLHTYIDRLALNPFPLLGRGGIPTQQKGLRASLGYTYYDGP